MGGGDSARSHRTQAKGWPPVHSQEELDRLLGACNAEDGAAFSTLLLTGLRDRELCHSTWDEVILERGGESLVVRGNPGITPKDDEERELPIPGELDAMLRARERSPVWVFPKAGRGEPDDLAGEPEAAAPGGKSYRAEVGFLQPAGLKDFPRSQFSMSLRRKRKLP